jgi:phosphoglycerol transferase MdoB-like AlkP superfamily enzyme
LFYFIQAAYLLLHLSYFCFFGEPFYATQIFSQFFEGISLIQHFAIPKSIKYFIALSDFPFFILILIGYLELNNFLRAYKKLIVSVRILIIVILVSSAIFYFKKGTIASLFEGFKNNQFEGETEIFKNIGLLGNDLFDLMSQKSEKDRINDLKYGERLIFNSNTEKQLNNVICIQVESLDAAIIDSMYKGRYVTPFLHELSNQCIYYPQMIFYSGTWHSNSMEFTVLNDAIPPERFSVFKLRHYDYPNSIIRSLSKFNYATLAFHNNFGAFFNRDMAYLKMGFQEFYDLKKMHLKEKGWGASDVAVMDYVIGKLRKQKAPFFYYIITMSSHEPYTNVSQYYKNEFYNDISVELIKKYFNSMSYVDGILQTLITYIRNNIKDTYIFIYGDHYAYDLKAFLFNPSKSVPLFIITPDNKKYFENNIVVSSLDLAPTILYASGIDFNLKAKGVNLLDFPIKEDKVFLADEKIASRKSLFRKFNNADFEGRIKTTKH